MAKYVIHGELCEVEEKPSGTKDASDAVATLGAVAVFTGLGAALGGPVGAGLGFLYSCWCASDSNKK
jgi:hypothetical protein